MDLCVCQGEMLQVMMNSEDNHCFHINLPGCCKIYINCTAPVQHCSHLNNLEASFYICFDKSSTENCTSTFTSSAWLCKALLLNLISNRFQRGKPCLWSNNGEFHYFVNWKTSETAWCDHNLFFLFILYYHLDVRTKENVSVLAFFQFQFHHHHHTHYLQVKQTTDKAGEHSAAATEPR